LGVYLVLLGLSYAWRTLWPVDLTREVAPGATITVRAVEETGHLGDPVELAFEQRGPSAGVQPAPAVLFLHGSPGSRAEVSGLGRSLSDAYRTIAPDLPGFGRSAPEVPSYSTAAHAGYAAQLLDRLEVREVHLVGFSMGGGVALELARRGDERIRSLTLLASIGAQEFELFGDYHLNHAVHGAQLAALWALHRLTPHFGLLDGSPLSIAYARNFFDTDQRPLRDALRALEVPTLILHGEKDFLVPVEAAREHHRLVPQSDLVVYPGGHFMAFQDPATVASDLREFFGRVDDGRATTRSQATPERRGAANRPFDPAALPKAVGPTLLVWVLLLAVATLVSEDLTCIASGLLVAQGRLDFAPAVLACALGIFVGDVALFLAGRYLGRPWLRRAPLKWWLDESRLARAAAWFERRGIAVIFLSRFWPGMRLPTYVAAGLLRTSLSRFALLFALAVAIWTPMLVGAAAWLGERWIGAFRAAQGSLGWVLLTAAVAAWLLATLRRLATPRGRRRWIGAWRRRLRWEFWPPWLVYPPVLIWIAWLGLRHRGLTAFTAANPAMPDGGFVGESKGDILEALPASVTARFLRLPARGRSPARHEAVRAFLDGSALQLPIVVKPDCGQRGDGVTIVRRQEQLERALVSPRALIVQEFVPGPELGVFYVRRPGDERGRIFSTTRKRLPELRGDGKSTFEELLLADGRAACLSDVYLAESPRPPDVVPADGERVPLVEVGTHCRGAIFEDGVELASPALEREVDRISRAYEGFYFGRYDFKAPTLEDFRAGRNLRVLELNGVTSEATHIYDPELSVLDAYRVLFRQWQLAFEIGAENRRRGAAVSSLRRLAKLAREHLSGGRDATEEPLDDPFDIMKTHTEHEPGRPS
jgi:pimeloyl-ACP methyl ester carboxylesterase/membrane protein DedA with SNARE-associated domain